MNNCNHPKSEFIIARQEYEGHEWVVFKCEDCGKACLAEKDGLEQRRVKKAVPAKQLLAYMLPDSSVPNPL